MRLPDGRGESRDHSSGEPSRTLCKHFASVSPGMSGHWCQTDRAPMLVGTPLPVNLSVFVALGPALWIRRVLVLRVGSPGTDRVSGQCLTPADPGDGGPTFVPWPCHIPALALTP